MNKRTLKALKGSIRKWQKIIDGTGVDLGKDNCPLCAIFYKNPRKGCCHGCPVAIAAKDVFCHSTPYDDYNTGDADDEADADENLAAAVKELRFLKSLLPKSASKKASTW